MLSLVGCTKMNVELSKKFPDRTLDAIKGMRRLAKYKARVAKYLEEVNLLPTLSEMDVPPPEQGSQKEDSESRVELSGDNGRASSSYDPCNESGDTLPVDRDMGPINRGDDGNELTLDEMLESSERMVTGGNVSEGEMMNVVAMLDGGRKPPGRKGEGSGGVSPLIPPCNPGKADENRTNRDGDGTGGSFTLRRSKRITTRRGEGATKGTPAGRERPERDESTRSEKSHEEEEPPPTIPPCNPGREDASQTAQDGDAVAGGGESGSWATMCESADESECASPPIPPCTPGLVQDGDAAGGGFAGSSCSCEEEV